MSADPEAVRVLSTTAQAAVQGCPLGRQLAPASSAASLAVRLAHLAGQTPAAAGAAAAVAAAALAGVVPEWLGAQTGGLEGSGEGAGKGSGKGFGEGSQRLGLFKALLTLALELPDLEAGRSVSICAAGMLNKWGKGENSSLFFC